MLDLATVVDEDRLAVMLGIGLAKRQITLDKLDRRIVGSNGHRGTGRLRRVLTAESEDPGSGRTRAEMEAMFLPMLRAIPGLPPYLRNHLLELAPGFVVRPDVWFPDRRVWLELDSRRWHEQRRAMDSDRRKDQRAVALGCLPFRITWRHLLHEWAAVRSDLCDVLAIT